MAGPVSASGNLWFKLAKMPEASSNFEVATLGEKIYALSPAFTYVFDTSTNSLASNPVMPTQSKLESALAVAVCWGKIFAFWGYDLTSNNNNINIGSALMFDPATDQWTTKASMPTPRSYMKANAVGDKIYLIGGWLKNTG